MKNIIEFNFKNMLDSNNINGISNKEIIDKKTLIEKVFNDVILTPSKETKAYFNLVENPLDLNEIKQYADDIAMSFEAFVVLGIGGSALGARALFAALSDTNYSRNEIFRNSRPRIFVRDTINPDKFKALLELINIKKTMFCIITKSGKTLETLLQAAIVIDKLKKELGNSFSKNLCIITANESSELKEFADKNNIKTFLFSPDLSGRFSVLSPVGLLPAAVFGADIFEIISGAHYILEKCKNSDLEENPALYGALLQKIAIEKGRNISYLMPYTDKLKVFSDWYCQLWAESLGKSTKNGFIGQTPVSAIGTIDQHSQMQLCLEGPLDKVVSFITVKNSSRNLIISEIEGLSITKKLKETSILSVVLASQKATEDALTKCGRLNQNIIIEELNEFSIGALLIFYMLETSFLGNMLGINPYDQPAVELIKQNIKETLNL